MMLEMQSVPFKPQAYERAAFDIENLSQDIKDLYKKGGLKALEDIPGVGQGIAERIEEYIKTRQIKDYNSLKKKLPIKIDELTRIEGIGPKIICKLYKELGIKNLSQLEKAARAGKISELEGFGKKSEEKILRGLEFVKKYNGRYVLGFILPTIREIVKRLDQHPFTDKIIVAGSVRRMQETIGDVDILIISKKPEAVMKDFIAMPEVEKIVTRGSAKSSVRLKDGLEIDLRVVNAQSFGAALQYFTGNKNHNIALRKIAIKKGYKLNEYGLFKIADSRGLKRGTTQKEILIAGELEKEIYKILGMDYIEPELRLANGEIEAAQNHKLPKLINYSSLKGDLQTHSNWTDGENSIEEMALAAQKIGLEYIIITDHTQSLSIASGLDEKKLLRQIEEINKLNSKLQASSFKFKVLKGAEVNILKDGSLDISDDILARLDVVGAAVHSHFNLSASEQTQRIIKAMTNKNVDILFHPTGRIINRRPAYEIDMEAVIKAAKKTNTVLEIDAYADRLDLKDEYIRKAIGAGVKLAIDSDAHSPEHFKYLELGIAQARRGWAIQGDIINAWPLNKMLEFLKK